MHERRELHPNAEFALGAICFLFDMIHGTGEAIFVIARCSGWLAHAIEEYPKDWSSRLRRFSNLTRATW
jgi:citrate synthase